MKKKLLGLFMVAALAITTLVGCGSEAKKEYVNYLFPLKKYLKNNSYIKLFDFIMQKRSNGQEYKISMMYDDFDMNNEPNLVDIINYNFEQNGNNEKYYNECLWNIVEKDLKNKQTELNQRFINSKDADERKEIVMQISNITKKLKNRIMED